MSVFSNELANEQLERLAFLAEELGEAQQAIGKIIRHGFESYNPTIDDGKTNRRELETELGHVQHAIDLLIFNRDLSAKGIIAERNNKRESVKKWMHHQSEACQ